MCAAMLTGMQSSYMPDLKSLLLALEVTEATSVGASATSTSTATTITTIWLRCSIVKSDGTASNIGTGHSLKSGLGIINGREGDVSEALGVTSLPENMLDMSDMR